MAQPDSIGRWLDLKTFPCGSGVPKREATLYARHGDCEINCLRVPSDCADGGFTALKFVMDDEAAYIYLSDEQVEELESVLAARERPEPQEGPR